MSAKENVLRLIQELPDDVSLAEIFAQFSIGGQPGDDAEAEARIHTVSLFGHVDANHRLTAEVPASCPPGPVKVLLILGSDEELSALQWSASVGLRWALEWDDPREAHYTLEDGEPVDGAK
jgi:hypothetical protein